MSGFAHPRVTVLSPFRLDGLPKGSLYCNSSSTSQSVRTESDISESDCRVAFLSGRACRPLRRGACETTITLLQNQTQVFYLARVTLLMPRGHHWSADMWRPLHLPPQVTSSSGQVELHDSRYGCAQHYHQHYVKEQVLPSEGVAQVLLQLLLDSEVESMGQ